MDQLGLSKSERELWSAIEAGETLKFTRGERIRADILRRIILDIPVPETELSADPSAGRGLCRKTQVGISVEGMTVVGTLDLSSAVRADGAPMHSLRFSKCRFEGQFYGAYVRFARLSMRDCVFASEGELEGSASKPGAPTLDLTSATVLSDLDLAGIRSAWEGVDLWICAQSARIDGKLDLSRASLRAPRGGSGEALELTMAQIGGDFHFIDGIALHGRLSLRGARVAGDVWMNRARIENRDRQAVFLQTVQIAGFLMMHGGTKGERAGAGAGGVGEFVCVGEMKLEAADIGCSLYLKDAIIDGAIEALDLSVRDDVFLDAHITKPVRLGGCRIGGSLDLSGLRIGEEGGLSIVDGLIGRVLRLARDEDSRPRTRGGAAAAEFDAPVVVDLRGVSCDTLDDRAGALWKRPTRIKMNHFVYRQATWEAAEQQPKSTSGRLLDWARSQAADRMWPWMTGWLWQWFRLTRDLREDTVCWSGWQVRRNWLYRQFEPDPRYAVPAQRSIREREYRPQPFEQTIRVARAEGREDIATRFEMLKARIEWRLFNLRVRWLLGAVGIVVATVWMLLKGSSPALSLLTLGLTWFLMLRASTTHMLADRKRLLTELVFYWPALYFVLVLDGWWRHPFHFIVAVALYLGVRYLSVLAHLFMRFGFGYLRRPGRAVATLILAFMLGWWGVHHADKRNMLVIAAEPAATRAAPNPEAAFPRGYDARGVPVVTGSERVHEGPAFAHELSCAAVVSEPLYALDVLIPLVDLGEERRCEIRRFADPMPYGNPESVQGPEAHRRAVNPRNLGLGQIFASMPALPLDDYRFWWWMKALYAIAGWIIVSLSLLTFAQANKTHAEPPGEKH